MTEISPYINPLRFRLTSETIDYDTVLPFDDKMELQTEYQRGIYPANYLANFSKGKVLYFELFADVTPIFSYARLYNAETGAYTSVNRLDITPSGWVGDEVHRYSVTLSDEGYYYFQVKSGTAIGSTIVKSDTFKVLDWLSSKDLVSINYYDTQNRYGGLFFDSSGVQLWNPTAYYTGYLKKAAPEDEVSSFDSDDGNITDLQNSPRRMWELHLTDISDKYVDVIKQQTICSHLYVNGQRFAATEFSTEDTEKSDIVDITIKLSMKDNNYYSILD